MKNQRIKIYYCIPALCIGGAERLLALHLKNLDRQRFEPKVLTIVRDGVFADELRAHGIEVRCMKKSTKLGLLTIWRLWRLFRREKPHIVHTHLFGGDTWGRIPAIFARVPIILTTEHLMNHDERGLKRWVKRILTLWTDRVVCVSDAVRQFSASVDRIPVKKLMKIYGPVDGKDLQSVPAIHEVRHRCAIIGRMDPRKGHELLLEACDQIKTEFPDLRVMVATTTGTSVWEEKIKRQIHERGLSKHMDWIFDQIDLRPLFQQTDVVVMPSRFEGLGLVALEAMAAGRMVIATDVPGLNELIHSGENGLMVAADDPASLAQALRYCFRHGEKVRAMAERGRVFALNKFSIQSFIDQYDRLYLDLLGEKGVISDESSAN